MTLFINTYSIVPDLPGVTSETHSITHHGGRQEALAQLFIIDTAWAVRRTLTAGAATSILKCVSSSARAALSSANPACRISMALAIADRSGDDFVNHMAMHVGEASVGAVVAERQPFVVEAQQV